MRHTVLFHFEVQVGRHRRRVGIAGLSDQTDTIALPHVLAGPYRYPGEVAVKRGHLPEMADDDVIAHPLFLIARNGHDSRPGCIHGGTYRRRKVHSPVLAAAVAGTGKETVAPRVNAHRNTVHAGEGTVKRDLIDEREAHPYAYRENDEERDEKLLHDELSVMARMAGLPYRSISCG